MQPAPPPPGQCDLAKSLRRSCTATAVWELRPSHRGGLAARLVRSEHLDGLGHSASRVSSQMSCAIRERCDWISPGKTTGKSPEMERTLLSEGSLEWPDHWCPACFSEGVGQRNTWAGGDRGPP